MTTGGLVAAFFAVPAEGSSLDDVAGPMSVVAKPDAAIFRPGRNGGPRPRPAPRKAGMDGQPGQQAKDTSGRDQEKRS